MQTRRLVIFMVAGMALIFGWQLFINSMYQRHPDWKKPGSATTQPVGSPAMSGSATNPAGMNPTATTNPAVATSGPTSGPTTAMMPLTAAPGGPRTVEIGSAKADDAGFRMAITLTSQGAGIEGVVLNKFTRTVSRADRYDYQRPLTTGAGAFVALATRSVEVDGVTTDLSGVNWTVEDRPEPGVAAFHIDISDGNGPVLRIRKVYQLSARSEVGDMGYEVQVSEQLQNLTKRELSVKTTLNGPVPPVRELDTSDDRQIVAAYNGEGRLKVTSHLLNDFKPELAEIDLTKQKDKAYPLVWFGASSVYFDAIVRPIPSVEGAASADYVAKVTATSLNPSAKPEDRLIGTTMTTQAFSLAGGGEQVVPLRVFFGPKTRALLQSNYYATFPVGYDQTLDTLNSGCANYCTVGPLISGLVWMLRAFYFVFRDWGLAIIGLVLVVRLVLHPITKKSQVNMAKMGKFGPEIERLKKKHGENKEDLNKAMMQFYKEHGFTPILGCLPMFLQMPIWIALWSALQNTFELRHANFLYGLTWIKDLSHPDRLMYFPDSGFSLIFLHIDALNVLPILMAGVFWLQQKYMPKAATATKEQESQQKMMQWMTLLFPLFLYNSPSGLNLYILTSTTIGIFESKRIRDHIKEREEAEKDGRVIVEARPTRGARRGDGGVATAEVKKGGIGGWLADLQAKAEEMRRKK